VAIGKKLTAVLTATLVVVALLSALAVTGFRSMRANTNLLIDNYARKLALAGKLENAAGDMLAAQRAMLLDAATSDDGARDRESMRFGQAYRQFRDIIQEIRPLLLTTQSRGLIAGAEDKAQRWQGRFAQLASATLDRKGLDNWTQQKAAFADLAEGIEKDTGDLSALLERQLGENRDAADASASLRVEWSLVLATVAAVIVILSFVVVNGINRQLREAIGSLSGVTGQLASAAEQISVASQAMAQSATEQAASTQETAAATDQVKALTRQNTIETRETSENVRQSMETMVALNRASSELTGSIEEVSASSEKIAGIIHLIDEIAFQTNILALNAAVEAARAGEAGRSFAVVADEVRNLAGRCARAAKDTSELIEGAVANTGKCREAMRNVLPALESNSRLGHEIQRRMGVVSLASEEQARSLENIAGAAAQIQTVTQQTAASAEENAAVGEELRAQARTLEDSVAVLTVLVEGRRMLQRDRP
jgi:methyl-accepting chemotaxis protein/methyl-accepting chemotaxis protein-1 (serine sensor receptor)